MIQSKIFHSADLQAARHKILSLQTPQLCCVGSPLSRTKMAQFLKACNNSCNVVRTVLLVPIAKEPWAVKTKKLYPIRLELPKRNQTKVNMIRIVTKMLMRSSVMHQAVWNVLRNIFDVMDQDHRRCNSLARFRQQSETKKELYQDRRKYSNYQELRAKMLINKCALILKKA